MRKEKFIIIGFIIMSFNSLYQYSWNALEPLLREGFNVSIVEISLGFSLFTIFSSGFQPLGGNFADKIGPRKVALLSSILSALGFLGTSFSPSVYIFFIFWSLGSIGEGILYGIASNLAVKWFKKRMAFATGLVSLGFGLGSAFADPFILMSGNFRLVTLIIGLTELTILPILSLLIEYPTLESGKSPKEAVLSRTFWLIYLSFVTATVPLLVISSSLSIIGKALPFQELSILISIFPILSGSGRPIFGHIADKLGVIKTTVIVDTIIVLGGASLLFSQIIPAVVIIGLAGGAVITLYFNVSGIVFGTRYSTVNNGILYTGKAVAGFLGSVIFNYLFLISPFLAYLFVIISSTIGAVTLYGIFHHAQPAEGSSQVRRGL
ncbi:oxalate/formate antiport family MFS transporter [Acidianus hospitalis]|uniref:Oxalate/formate antiport family MFS transporter n=1 Tax=Acidianus hospitalis TaxID=563177 RepID=A0A2T9XAU8_9CREN|nr:oxalate/formate antiport family MFS transporter [Acidianus hospitalis]